MGKGLLSDKYQTLRKKNNTHKVSKYAFNIIIATTSFMIIISITSAARFHFFFFGFWLYSKLISHTHTNH